MADFLLNEYRYVGEIAMTRFRQLLLLASFVLPSCAKADKLEPVHEDEPLHEWIAELRNPNPDVRMFAAHTLAKMGPEAKPAVPQLIKVSQDEDEDECVRHSAIWALEAIGPGAEAAVPHLLALLPNEKYGSSAGMALGNIGELALQPLLEALQGENDEASLHATMGLGEMGPKAKAAVVPLIAKLKEANVTRRYVTARVLGMIGPEARAAENPLRSLLKDEDAGVRVSATLALARINPEYVPTAVADLIAVLKDKKSEVHRPAAGALGDLGPAAKAGVPALIALLNDEQTIEIDRHFVVRALGRIGPAAKAAVPDLIVLLKGDDPVQAMFAAETLGQIGPEAKAAVPTLRAIVNSDDDLIREHAANALRKIDPKAVPRDSIP